jgi:hypothetical protein
MASRFVVADNAVVEELKTSTENLNTRKSKIYWLEYLINGQHSLRNIGEDMETYNVQELDKFTINLRIIALCDQQVIA